MIRALSSTAMSARKTQIEGSSSWFVSTSYLISLTYTIQKQKKKIEYTALSEPFYTPTDFRSVLRDAPT